jgi:hypothetical protein
LAEVDCIRILHEQGRKIKIKDAVEAMLKYRFVDKSRDGPVGPSLDLI